MNEYNIDAFIGLTRGPAWKINYAGGDNIASQEVLSLVMVDTQLLGDCPILQLPILILKNFQLAYH